MVKVKFEGFHSVQNLREKLCKVGSFRRREAKASTHEAGVFGLENGFVFVANLMDNSFCALDEFRREAFGDAFRDEFFVIDVGASTDEFAKGFTKADEVPPDDGGLIFIAVAEGMVVVVRRVGGVEVVQEGKGPEVEGEAEKRSVVGIEDTIGEGVGLPSGHGQGVAASDFAVEAGEAVFFGAGRTLNFGVGDRARWVECSGADWLGVIEGGWKRQPSFIDMLSNVGC